MATLKTIRKRITSVRNTQKITKAMKMVAAAKLRRAQMAVVASRPFADRLREVLNVVAEREANSGHPLLKSVENPKKAAFLLFTSNRGLCGGFNSTLLRKLETHLNHVKSRYELIDLSVIGKKGRDFYKVRHRDPKEVFLEYADKFPFAEAQAVADRMMEGFEAGEYDEYYIVYNRFKSALSQEVEFQKILPFTAEKPAVNANTHSTYGPIFEPGKKEILDYLIPKYVATQIYRAHLESLASELGARMTAMENATKNAKEMIGLLTLEYNRLRQAAITTELMDIVNGAEAIK